jgi:chromosome segregation ATPase
MIQLLEEAAMGFTVRDFNDLMRLLDRHPEWVEALRQRLLTRELLDSPKTLRRLSLRVGRVERAVEDLKATVQDLAQSVQALTQSVAALIQAQQQRDEAFAAFRAEVDRRFAELAEAQRRTEEALAAHRAATTEDRASPNSQAQRRHYEEFAAHRQEFEYRAETDRRFAELATAIQALAQRVDNLSGQVRGWVHEDRYRTRPRRYRRLLLDPHILSTEAREALLRQAEAAGRLTPEEAAELEDADVLVQGRSRATGGEAFLVVEVSAKVNTDDVERAVKRAEILRKARPEAEVIPVAAGPEIHPLAARAARDRGVWWLTDGRPYAPHEIPQEP